MESDLGKKEIHDKIIVHKNMKNLDRIKHEPLTKVVCYFKKPDYKLN